MSRDKKVILTGLPDYENPPPPPPRPGSFYDMANKLLATGYEFTDDAEMEIGQLNILKSKIDQRINELNNQK